MIWRVRLTLGYREAFFDFLDPEQAIKFCTTVKETFNEKASDDATVGIALFPVDSTEEEEK